MYICTYVYMYVCLLTYSYMYLCMRVYIKANLVRELSSLVNSRVCHLPPFLSPFLSHTLPSSRSPSLPLSHPPSLPLSHPKRAATHRYGR